jgi:Icc protein
MPGTDGRDIGPVLARCDRPRSKELVRFGVIADPHVTPSHEGTWKLYHRTEEHLETAFDRLATADVDHLVLAGDLTKNGSAAQYDRFDDLAAPFPAPQSAIPGNHDVPKRYNDTGGLGPGAFADRYGADGFPWVREIGEVSLVGVNSAATRSGGLADTWGGRVSRAQLDRLDSLLPELSRPVLFVHHNCGPLPEHPSDGPWERFSLDNAAALLECCEHHGVSLIVSGHHHVPAVRKFGSVTEVMAPALCSFPNACLLLTVTATGTTIRIVPVADAAGLRESYAAARTGKPLGVGIIGFVETRLAERPCLSE